MFQNLKNIFEKVKQDNNSQVEIIEEEIYAVLSLLIEACKVDGIISDDEIEKITSLLINKFHLVPSKAKNAVNFVLEKENEKVGAMKPLSIRLKPLSKSQIHEPADNLENVDDDRVASDNDSDTDKAKDKQRNAARRRTLAADATTVNKEKKTAQRRKSIQPTLHKDPIVPQVTFFRITCAKLYL